MNYNTILESLYLFCEGKEIPKVMQIWADTEVDMCETNLKDQHTTFCGIYDNTLDMSLYSGPCPPIGETWCPHLIEEALKKFSCGDVDYGTFVGEIMKAGACRYTIEPKRGKACFSNEKGLKIVLYISDSFKV